MKMIKSLKINCQHSSGKSTHGRVIFLINELDARENHILRGFSYTRRFSYICGKRKASSVDLFKFLPLRTKDLILLVHADLIFQVLL